MPHYKIVITSDRATMTNYSDFNALGFLLCLPKRLIPKFLVDKFIAPRLRVDKKTGWVNVAPYALRKLEAALIMRGFSPIEDFVITTPENLPKVVNEETRIVAIHVLDPMGLAPVSYTLRVLFGGGDTWTKTLFLKLMDKVRKLKEKYNFKIVVGGPGTWQIRDIYRKFGIDLLIHGEGELIFPEVCKLILEGEDISGELDGGSVPLELIPPILNPARGGMVQITRGCPRRCRFCNPTMFNFRSIPLDIIRQEIEVNKRAGYRAMSLVTEDGLLYGAKGVRVNKEALRKLLKVVKECSVRADFCHVSLAAVKQAPDIVEEWSRENEHFKNFAFPQVGLETGSVRLLKKYMAGKAAPWRVEDWHEIAEESTEIMNRNYWYPCYTLILGLPEETEDDAKATLELIKRLDKYRCWIFPLFFVPMGHSMLEHENFAKPEILKYDIYREILYETLEHNIKFTKFVLDKFVERIKSKYAQKLVRKFIEYGLSAFENVKNQVRSNLDQLLDMAAKVDLNSFVSVTKLVFESILAKFRRKVE